MRDLNSRGEVKRAAMENTNIYLQYDIRKTGMELFLIYTLRTGKLEMKPNKVSIDVC